MHNQIDAGMLRLRRIQYGIRPQNICYQAAKKVFTLKANCVKFDSCLCCIFLHLYRSQKHDSDFVLKKYARSSIFYHQLSQPFVRCVAITVAASKLTWVKNKNTDSLSVSLKEEIGERKATCSIISQNCLFAQTVSLQAWLTLSSE